MSVAANNDVGSHLQDYIFHVTKDTSTGELLVAASNNTNFDPREDLETLDNFFSVQSPGWYTFEHLMYEGSTGNLEVALSLYDETEGLLFTEVRDSGSSNFGGNRYLWFTNIDVADGIPVDGVTLSTVDMNPIQAFDGSAIVGTFATIQDVIDAAAPGETLRLSGADPGSADVNKTITLGGDFTLGNSLTVSDPAATLDAGFSPGVITSGSLSLTSGSTLTAEVDGVTPGTEHDQYVVTGTVSLGGATLDAFGTITSSPGDTIVLIDNDLTDAVSGTFAGIANGDIVTINSEDFALFYDGGDGNDVVLVAAPATNIVYVDDDWSGTSNGADPDGAGPAVAFGLNAFDNITDALAAVDVGGTVYVFDGAYAEALSLTQDVNLVADNTGGADVNAGGAFSGVTVGAAVTASIAGFDFDGFLGTGIDAQGDATITDSTITGGFTGLSVDGSIVNLGGTIISGASIFGAEVTSGGSLIADLSEFTSNGTAGVIVSNGSADIDQSVISGNGRGVIVGATGAASIFGSDLSGNTGDAVENASASVVDASGNWWGSAVEVDVLDATTGLVDFTPFLTSAADATGASPGFAGDFSGLFVTSLGSQTGAGRVQEGVDLADAVGMVTVGDGVYDESISINKSLTLEAENKFNSGTLTPSGALIAPTTGSQQTVVTISATNVTLDGLGVQVNQNDDGLGAPIAPVGIAAIPATTADFDGLLIQNVDVSSIGDNSINWASTPSLTVHAAGIVLFDSPSGSVPTVTLSDNRIDIDSGSSFFQRAVWLAQTEADVTDNTLSGAANDLLFQFASAGTTGDGASLIDGNDFVGQHRGGGGGLNISGPNASATAIDISGNLFQPTAGDPFNVQQAVVINQNTNSVPINITGNTFDGHVVGIASGNSANVNISGANAFTPTTHTGDLGVQAALGGSDFVHIAIDSDAPSSGDSLTLPNAAEIFGNTFNASPTVGAIGTAIAVADNLAGSTFALDGIEIGVAGANTYSAGLSVGVAVSGGVATIADSISNADTGVALSGGSAVLSNATLSGNTTGIFAAGSGTLTFGLGNSITGGVTGILLDGVGVDVPGLDLNDVSISGQSGDYISLANMAFDDLDLDATGTTLGGVDVSTATPAQLAVLGDKITDEIDDNTLGQVLLAANTIFVTPVLTPTATDNDYTRIKNAVEAAGDGDTIVLAANGAGDAVFNWDEANAMASWYAGNDGIADGGADDWTILLGAGQNNVTVTAANLPFGDPDRVAIQGPGDVAAANLEGVFVAFGNTTNTGWTFENFDILDFDNAIGFYFSGGDDYSDLTVQNMRIQVAADDSADANQNIGIHYGRGTNITIQDNLFELVGGGDGTTFAIQSNTHGGANYDGLAITGNTINVLSAGDENLFGVWENGHAHGSNISVSDNTFNGIAGNAGDQVAFRITSHSGATSTVQYDNNIVDQADVAFDWLDVYFGTPQDYTGTLPIEMAGNTVTNTGTAFDIGGINASANISGGSITGASGVGVNIADGNSATVSGVTLQNLDVGVQVGGSADLQGNFFDNASDNLVDVLLESTASSIAIDAANTLGGDTYFIENLSTLDLDLSGALPTFDETDNFRIEDKLYHAVDDPASGLVRIVAGELFVSTNGTGASDETIQNAVDAADAGDLVNVEAGTFTENVSITKDIDIQGDAGGGTTVAASSGFVFTIAGAGFGTADNEVTLDYLNLDGSGGASRGVSADSSVDLGELSVTNANISGFSTYGVGIFGDGTNGDTVDQVTLDSLSFSGNGAAAGGGTGDIQFFTFNNDATLSNLTLVGSDTAGTDVRSGIQFRGVGAGDGTGLMTMGTVSLTNVDISGDYQTQMIGIQRYSDVDNLSFSGVKLGGAGSEITGTFGSSLRFDGVGTGSLATPATFDLNDTEFRGLDVASAQVHEIEFAPDNSFAFLRVDGTNTTWSGIAASSLTLSEAFDVEDRILHYVDKLNPTHGGTFGAYKGFVDIQANQTFITDQADAGVIGDGSIQRGIDISNTGATVNVSDGNFVEGDQIVVDKEVDVIGQGQGVTILNPGFDTGSSGNARGWWLVESTGDLDISGMTFDGGGNLVYQAFRHLGVGSFDDVEFTEIKFNESGPNYQGVGIAAFGGVGAVDVTNSMFSEIGRIGVLYFGAGTTGTFQGNTYVGKGTGDWLDYALDISAGAVIDVIGNDISGNQGVASSDGSTSAGILVSTFFAPGTTANLSGNEVYDNSTGVFVGFNNADTSTVTLSGDNIHDNVGDGVFVIGASVTVSGDTLLTDNGGAGVEINDQATGIISGNTTSFTGNSVGVEVDGGTARVEGNNLNGNTIGVLVQNDGIADLGQSGAGVDFTGLGVSAGGNDFSGFPAAASATNGAIVNLNTGGDYSNAGPQGVAGSIFFDVTAFNNTFSGTFTTPGDIDTVVYHDTDDTNLGFVDYANLLDLTVSLDTLPTIVTNDSIDEGGSVTVSGEFTNVSQSHTVTISWGDGSPDTVIPLAAGVFDFSAVSPAGTYIDDPDGAVQTVNNAITVTVEETFGTDSAMDGSLSVDVNNVIPVVPLADVDGDNEINEGETFNLSIGPAIDPGDDTIVAYEIDWGDGSPVEFFAGDPLTSASTQSHLYEDGLANPSRTIKVNVLDEDGTWMEAGMLDILVNNVAPTAADFLAFNTTIDEGSTTNVFFVGPFVDPGDPDTPFHFAFDFNGNGVYGEAGELGDGTYAGSPTTSSATVPAQFLADDDDSPRTVRARIIDNDGGFTEYMVDITIDNVAPVVDAGPDDTAFPNVPVDHVISFTDPGADAPWAVSIDWDGDLSFDETFNVPTNTFNIADFSTYTYSPGDIGSTFTVTVHVDDNDGGVDSDAFDLTIVEDTLQVIDFAPHASGFDAQFNRAIDLTTLNIYDGFTVGTPHGASDVIVTLGGNVVDGSIDWDPSTNTLSFVNTGSVLADGTYDVTLRSAADALQDTSASLLDGDFSGSAGGDFVTSFIVSSAGERIVSIPDFARGVGQDVNVPPIADGGADLPVTIDDATSVTAVDFDVLYDPSLLEITAATLGDGPSAAGGWSITTNDATPGVLKVTISGVVALSGLDVELVKLDANVPGDAPYGDSQIIRIDNLRVNEDAIASRADAAVHKAVFLGDADGDGTYLGFDSALISRVVVDLDSGFHAHRWTDPVIVADATRDGTLSGQDASLVAQESVFIDTDEIPPLSASPIVAASGGVDPELIIGTNLVAVRGSSVTVPVDLDVLPAESVISSTHELFYDNSVLDYLSATNGSSWTNGDGWSIFANEPQSGQVRVTMFNSTPSATGLQQISQIEFAAATTPSLGDTSTLNGEPASPSEGGLTWTETDGSVVFTDLTGDYNDDGVVDAADYTVWRDTLGDSVPSYSGADGDGSGLIDQDDYLVWKSNYGSTFTPVPGTFESPAAVLDEAFTALAQLSASSESGSGEAASATGSGQQVATPVLVSEQSLVQPAARKISISGEAASFGLDHQEQQLLLLADAIFSDPGNDEERLPESPNGTDEHDVELAKKVSDSVFSEIGEDA